MKKRIEKRHLFILLPLLIGAGIALWVRWRFDRFPVIHMRVDAASLGIVGGVAGSVVVLLFFVRQKAIEYARSVTFQQAALERRQFLQRLDHELKNPLSTIKMGLSYLGATLDDAFTQTDLAANAPSADEFQSFIGQIDSQTQRIARLISDLRKLSDLEVRALDLTGVDLNQLLEQLIIEIRENSETAARQISLSLPKVPWQLPKIQADEDLIFLALRNLLENAVKYTDANGSIEVRAYENHHHLIVEIADSGMGIPENEIEDIWSELYRAENARAIAGNGLGLAIVRTIIKRHRGEVSVRSRNGQGTVFSISLPK